MFISYADMFSHTVAYLEPRTLCNSCIFRAVTHSESRHIYNPRNFQNFVKAFSGTLCNTRVLRTFHIQNFAIFKSFAYLRPEVYSESYLWRHIQANSGIFNNDSYDNNNFSFFKFNLTWFSTKFKNTKVF